MSGTLETDQNSTLASWMPGDSQTLTYSPQDSLARLFQLLEKGSVLRTLEARYFLKSLGLRDKNDLACYSLRTLRDYCSMNTGGPSESCSLRWMSWGTMSNGKLSTANISFHKADRGCSLSHILEANPSSKYFLSENMQEKMRQMVERSSSHHRSTSNTRQEMELQLENAN